MNNKYLGNLSQMLFSPDREMSGSGATVESPAGAAPGAAKATENIYGSEAAAPEGGEGAAGAGAAGGGVAGGDGAERPDFTDGGGEGGEGGQGAEGGEGGEGAQGGEGAEPELDEHGNPKPPVVAPAAKEPVIMKLDAETLAALRQQAPAAPAARQEPAKLTPQQLKEMLNPVEVTDEIVANMVHEDPAVRKLTMQNFANATVKNAVSVARVLIKQARQEVEAALGPISQNMEKQQAEAQKGEFYTINKDLVKYEKIVGLAASEVSHLNADGTEKTKAQIFKEVADKTRVTLKGYGISLSPNANPGAGPANGNGNRQVPAPNRLSGSGRSGGDNNGQRGKGNNPDADIYSR